MGTAEVAGGGQVKKKEIFRQLDGWIKKWIFMLRGGNISVMQEEVPASDFYACFFNVICERWMAAALVMSVLSRASRLGQGMLVHIAPYLTFFAFPKTPPPLRM